MRLVLDTNVLISALIAPHGIPAQIMAHLHRFDLLLTKEIVAEVERVLHYPRIQRRYTLNERMISEYLEHLRAVGLIIEPSPAPPILASDPSDDKFLICALFGGADAIVSGDHHLRDLGTFAGIPIASPAEMLTFLDEESPS